MRGLISNELMKIYSRRLTQILLLLLVIFAAGASIFMKMNYKPSRDWRAETEQLIQTNEERLKLAELSPQLQAEAENKIKIAKYRLENNIPVPFGNPWLALLKLTGLVEMVEIVAIIIAADMVAREYTDGTMKFLLIRPHKPYSGSVVEIYGCVSVCSYDIDIDCYMCIRDEYFVLRRW